MTRRDGRQSGILATLLIAKDCSLQHKSGHILAEEYSKITLARSKTILSISAANSTEVFKN